MKKRAVIFLNGDPPTQGEILASMAGDPFAICADGAYSYLKGVVRPHVLLGDFDSLDPAEVEEGVRVVRFPADKDYTDGHLAVELALGEGCRTADIYGGFGGRPDMAYANLSLLYQLKRNGGYGRLIGGGYTVTLESGAFSAEVKPGACVSLVPFFESAHILSTKGLKYPLSDAVLDRMHILGVSNVATESRVAAETEGELLVFIQTGRSKP